MADNHFIFQTVKLFYEIDLEPNLSLQVSDRFK